MIEEWREVRSLVGWEASNLGRLRPTHKWAKRFTQEGFGYDNGKGYRGITIRVNGKSKRFYVHRLVCEAFHGPAPSPSHHAAHGNGIRHDNRPSNLSWKLPIENEADKILHGTKRIGENHPSRRLTDLQVRSIVFERTQWNAPVSVLVAHYGVSAWTIYKSIRSAK
ncbi:hypothetical protein ASD54_12500 [Rhizobium sp. Root149]|nr:hypothetical protein ASD54_12500 [Rhizobium sp. Root149]